MLLYHMQTDDYNTHDNIKQTAIAAAVATTTTATTHTLSV